MNTILPAPNGPYFCGGDFVVVTASGARTASQATLCRCGGSAKKPFCDSSHERLRFTDAGRLPANATSGRAERGTATLTPLRDGPLRVDGPVTIVASDGCTSTGDAMLLCRCGGSSSKPFCDGTHRRNGFSG